MGYVRSTGCVRPFYRVRTSVLQGAYAMEANCPTQECRGAGVNSFYISQTNGTSRMLVRSDPCSGHIILLIMPLPRTIGWAWITILRPVSVRTVPVLGDFLFLVKLVLNMIIGGLRYLCTY